MARCVQLRFERLFGKRNRKIQWWNNRTELQIKGKKAILAGGSADMGPATADRLAEAGVELFITARRKECSEKAATEISTRCGVNVTPIVADSFKPQRPSSANAILPGPRYFGHYDYTTSTEW